MWVFHISHRWSFLIGIEPLVFQSNFIFSCACIIIRYLSNSNIWVLVWDFDLLSLHFVGVPKFFLEWNCVLLVVTSYTICVVDEYGTSFKVACVVKYHISYCYCVCWQHISVMVFIIKLQHRVTCLLLAYCDVWCVHE
jgi:hypothetical protein